MTYDLSEGALEAIMAGQTVDKPVLQILGHKKLVSASSGDRYRLLLSDGVKINSFTMLATQYNHMMETELIDFTIVQINRYAISNVTSMGKPRKVMVILNLDIIESGVNVPGKIKNPIQMEQNGDGSDVAPTAQSSTGNTSTDAAKETPIVVKKSRFNPNLTSTTPSSDITTTPIAALSPYQNRWVIKARVSNKSGVRTWSNSRGEGKFFWMELVDESAEIKCTGFNEQCDQFYNMVELGMVYYISRCSLKPANKRFSSLKNDYEMSLTNDSQIVACHDNTDDVPSTTYNFKPLSDVENMQKNDLIDVLGVVKICDEPQTLISRQTGRELRKRDIHIVDMSNVQVTLTFWGSQADEFKGENNPVVACKNIRVSEFQGAKSLSTFASSVVLPNPDLPEAHKLRGWFNSSGKEHEFKILGKMADQGGMNAPIMTILEATRKSVELTDGSALYVVKACCTLIRKESVLYKSCPTEGCKKKVLDQANGMYRCEKCIREFPNYKHRMLMSMNLSDWSGNLWATAFSDEAEKYLGMTAQELGEIMESDQERFNDIFAKTAFQYNMFKIRARKETYNDETRVRSVIVGVSPVEHQLYHTHLMEELKRLTNVEKE